MIAQDFICADLHDMGHGLFRNSLAETTCDVSVRVVCSKPGRQTVGSVTIEWLTTEAVNQSSLHCIVGSTDAMSDHIGHVTYRQMDRQTVAVL